MHIQAHNGIFISLPEEGQVQEVMSEKCGRSHEHTTNQGTVWRTHPLTGLWTRTLLPGLTTSWDNTQASHIYWKACFVWHIFLWRRMAMSKLYCNQRALRIVVKNSYERKEIYRHQPPHPQVIFWTFRLFIFLILEDNVNANVFLGSYATDRWFNKFL